MDEKLPVAVAVLLILAGVYYISLEDTLPRDASDLVPQSPAAYVVYVDTLRDVAENAGPQQPDDNIDYRLLVLTDSSCEQCHTREIVGYLEDIFPGLRIFYVEESSVTGERLIEKYRLKTVPSYILNLDVESSPNFDDVSKAFTKVGDGYIVNLDDAFVGKRL